MVCHAHPEHGGSKDHPILWAVRNELASRGFAVLAFNFRGVMGSGGTHGEGIGEIHDVRAALDRVRQEVDGPTFAAGWSFGANVALRTALEDERIRALALIGIPLAETGLALPDPPPPEALGGLTRPVLLLAGEADPFCPLPELRALSRRLPDARVEAIGDTDHFLWRHEKEAASLIGAFAEEALFGRSG